MTSMILFGQSSNDSLHAGEAENWQLLSSRGRMPQQSQSGSEGLEHSWRDAGLQSMLEG